MSRLIVKNLPNTVTNERLKEHFSSQGEVTDVQLKYTREGKFRHFAFIGFQSADEAKSAVTYFNNTFIDQSKIIVQPCSELGDSNKPKSWSKYALDSTAYKKLHREENKPKEEKKEKAAKEKKIKGKKIDASVVEKIKKYKDDPMFLEFMENATKEGSTKEIFKSVVEDEDSGVEEEAVEDSVENKDDLKNEPVKETSAAFAPISDLDYMKLKQKSSDQVKCEDLKNVIKKESQLGKKEKLHTVKVTNLPYKTTKKHLKDFFRPLKPASFRLPPKSSGFAYVSFKMEKEVKKAMIKNKSFLNGKQILVKEYIEKKEENNFTPDKVEDKRKRWRDQEEALFKEESIAESGSLFARNLPYTTTEEDLTRMFEPYGPLAEVNVPVDRESRRPKGFAVVTFVMPEHAVAAHSALDGTVFRGRMLHLLPAKTDPHKTAADDDDGQGKSFKDKKKEKLKASAGQTHTWNSLFLGQNAVVDMMAETYNVTKQQVLTGKDVAVRLALGETQLVSEMRQFLIDSGVSLDAFNQAPKARSKTVILVKNLPAKTTATEIREEFCKFGELGRVVLPPAGVTGIVEFLEPSEARKAFFSLAYKKFKHLPLYLEWAPEDTFTSAHSESKGNESEKNEGSIRVQEESNTEGKQEKTQESDDEEEVEPETDTTLFVKNLHFDTKEDSLKKHFGRCGRVARAMVARKLDPSRAGQWLSMGYGFVQYYAHAHLESALKTLQHTELDGHQLELKRSNRTLSAESSVTRKKSNVEKQTGTTIIVRNIPFQAKQKEIRQLFETFGELKSLRLPKKMVGSGPHRGFCFVEFLTKHDAKRAMKALCQSTHLFGRRLVLEWAKTDADDVDAIRKRTAATYGRAAEQPQRSKKARADLEIEEDDEDDN